MKLTDLTPLADFIEEERKHAEFREAWDRTAFARKVALKIISYRIDNDLSQTQLAHAVGMTQSVIARLESGDQPPSIATLAKLSAHSGLEFHLDIAEGAVALSA